MAVLKANLIEPNALKLAQQAIAAPPSPAQGAHPVHQGALAVLEARLVIAVSQDLPQPLLQLSMVPSAWQHCTISKTRIVKQS